MKLDLVKHIPIFDQVKLAASTTNSIGRYVSHAEKLKFDFRKIHHYDEQNIDAETADVGEQIQAGIKDLLNK